jgi:hypothetical protein
MRPEYPERITDHGQATGKLYHLQLRVVCTLFGLFGQKSEGGLSTDSRKPGGLFGSSETSVSTTDVKGGVFGGGASGGLSFTSVAKHPLMQPSVQQ